MSKELNKFANHYNSTDKAESYKKNRFTGSKKWVMTDERERQLFSDAVKKLSPKSLLDAPCGGGRFLGIWDSLGVTEVFGIDASESMLEVARGNAPESIKANLQHGDIRKLPFDDNRFEFVASIRLLHRISRPEARIEIFSELSRVSSRYVMFTFYNSRTIQGLSKWLKGKYAGESVSTLTAELKKAGLKVIESTPMKGIRYQNHFLLCEIISD